MICSNCGREIKPVDASYCRKCGACYCKNCAENVCPACLTKLGYFS